jgi:hypothetical protein
VKRSQWPAKKTRQALAKRVFFQTTFAALAQIALVAGLPREANKMTEEHSFKSRELAPIESLARNASYSFVHVGIKQGEPCHPDKARPHHFQVMLACVKNPVKT